MSKEDKKGTGWSYLLILVVVLVYDFLRPIDDTDKSRLYRSDMNLHIDYGTGCHYLSGGGFLGKEKLIARLDKKGKHICKGDK